MTALILGPVSFVEWELPERMPFGSGQTVVTHRLIGGKRVIDAMGPDDAEITWEGRFRGPLAELRARRVDLLRRSGEAVTLTWSTFIYRVVVTAFKAEWFARHEIPYSLTVTVVADIVSDAAARVVRRIEDAIRSDLAEGLGIAETSPVLTGVMTGAQTLVSSALSGGRLSLATLGGAALAGVQAGVADAAVTALGEATAADAVIAGSDGVPGGVAAGGDPAVMARGLDAQATAASDAYTSRRVVATLGRISAGTAQAGGAAR